MSENLRKKYTHVTSLDDVFSESSKKHSIEKKMSFESTSATVALKTKQCSLPTLLSSIFKEWYRSLESHMNKGVCLEHNQQDFQYKKRLAQSEHSTKTNDKAKVIDVQQLEGDASFLLCFECYSEDILSQLSEKFSQHPDVENFSLASDVPRPRMSNARTMWFPRSIADLDICAKNVLMYGSELDADHPGFKDEAYRKRRKFFTNIALNYKHGDPIPHVDYTKEEIKTWGEVYNRLTELYPTYACKQFLQNLPLLSLYCNYSKDTVPQLETVSQFLQEKTGFRIRPVAGFLSPRDFLAGLAFRVFNCTQYIRHSSDPLYTPEPDVCHELLGHVPLLADLEFAQYSQEIGLASLGASDDDISKLAACYLYTVEFGLCKEEGQLKAYGAGLLSSISELKHALTTPEKVVKFDPIRASTQEFYVTTFQPVYFVSESFEEAQKDMRNFVKNIKRPFSVRFDPLTNSIHVIDSLSSLQSTVRSLSHDVNLISNALQQILTSK